MDRLLRDLVGVAEGSDSLEKRTESIGLIGCLLDKHHITNADDDYRSESLIGELRTLRLSGSDVDECLSAFRKIILSPDTPAEVRGGALWSISKAPGMRAATILSELPTESPYMTTEDEAFQWTIAVNAMLFDGSAAYLPAVRRLFAKPEVLSTMERFKAMNSIVNRLPEAAEWLSDKLS